MKKQNWLQLIKLTRVATLEHLQTQVSTPPPWLVSSFPCLKFGGAETIAEKRW